MRWGCWVSSNSNKWGWCCWWFCWSMSFLGTLLCICLLSLGHVCAESLGDERENFGITISASAANSCSPSKSWPLKFTLSFFVELSISPLSISSMPSLQHATWSSASRCGALRHNSVAPTRHSSGTIDDNLAPNLAGSVREEPGPSLAYRDFGLLRGWYRTGGKVPAPVSRTCTTPRDVSGWVVQVRAMLPMLI